MTKPQKRAKGLTSRTTSRQTRSSVLTATDSPPELGRKRSATANSPLSSLTGGSHLNGNEPRKASNPVVSEKRVLPTFYKKKKKSSPGPSHEKKRLKKTDWHGGFDGGTVQFSLAPVETSKNEGLSGTMDIDLDETIFCSQKISSQPEGSLDLAALLSGLAQTGLLHQDRERVASQTVEAAARPSSDALDYVKHKSQNVRKSPSARQLFQSSSTAKQSEVHSQALPGTVRRLVPSMVASAPTSATVAVSRVDVTIPTTSFSLQAQPESTFDETTNSSFLHKFNDSNSFAFLDNANEAREGGEEPFTKPDNLPSPEEEFVFDDDDDELPTAQDIIAIIRASQVPQPAPLVAHADTVAEQSNLLPAEDGKEFDDIIRKSQTAQPSDVSAEVDADEWDDDDNWLSQLSVDQLLNTKQNNTSDQLIAQPNATVQTATTSTEVRTSNYRVSIYIDENSNSSFPSTQSSAQVASTSEIDEDLFDDDDDDFAAIVACLDNATINSQDTLSSAREAFCSQNMVDEFVEDGLDAFLSQITIEGAVEAVRSDASNNSSETLRIEDSDDEFIDDDFDSVIANMVFPKSAQPQSLNSTRSENNGSLTENDVIGLLNRSKIEEEDVTWDDDSLDEANFVIT